MVAFLSSLVSPRPFADMYKSTSAVFVSRLLPYFASFGVLAFATDSSHTGDFTFLLFTSWPKFLRTLIVLRLRVHCQEKITIVNYSFERGPQRSRPLLRSSNTACKRSLAF